MFGETESYSVWDPTEFPQSWNWEGLSLILVLDISAG